MITIQPSCANPRDGLDTRQDDPAGTLLGKKLVGISGDQSKWMFFNFEGGGSIAFYSDKITAEEDVMKAQHHWEISDRAQRTAAIVSMSESLEIIATAYIDRKNVSAPPREWVDTEQLSLIDAADRVLSNFRTVEEVGNTLIVRGAAWHKIDVLRRSVKELELAHHRALLDIAANKKEDPTS